MFVSAALFILFASGCASFGNLKPIKGMAAMVWAYEKLPSNATGGDGVEPFRECPRHGYDLVLVGGCPYI